MLSRLHTRTLVKVVTADKTSEDEQDLDLLLERTSLFTEAVIRLCLLSLGLSRV